jgi:hypothetical protein
MSTVFSIFLNIAYHHKSATRGSLSVGQPLYVQGDFKSCADILITYIPGINHQTWP